MTNNQNKTVAVASTPKQNSTLFEEGKVKFFWMNENYNNFLRGIDKKVQMSHKQGKARPSISVGIVFNGHNYIIPLTSQYDSRWNNQMTLKIKEQQLQPDGQYKEVVKSCLKLNNMHPALESELTYIRFDNQTEEYKRLLYFEFDYIKKNIEDVIKKANQTYKKVTKSKLPHFVNESVNFKLLENEYTNYDPTITYPKPR
ncbi:type III toxin-antitoxin system ToxN/AbiQ family toxin [Lysinibacillus fusiformis]|uniref:type III toxin-antitoxin system ToxN/AbiQ family toxin n=1 Tax=Lysinibacillus fusiformis TaxID=28031 RepID=UPI003D091AF8